MDSKLFDLEGGGGSSSRSSTNTEEEGSSAQGGTCDDGLLFLPLVALVSLYLGYLVECWHSTTRLVLVSFRSFRYLLSLSLLLDLFFVCQQQQQQGRFITMHY